MRRLELWALGFVPARAAHRGGRAVQAAATAGSYGASQVYVCGACRSAVALAVTAVASCFDWTLPAVGSARPPGCPDAVALRRGSGLSDDAPVGRRELIRSAVVLDGLAHAGWVRVKKGRAP